MEYRHLGRSGFKVPVLSFGTGTFGGQGQMFAAWGNTDVEQARSLVDICLEAGVNMFDSADIYSAGSAESILGAALRGRRRDEIIISTKATFRSGPGPNDVGSSRYHLVQAVDASGAVLPHGLAGLGGLAAGQHIALTATVSPDSTADNLVLLATGIHPLLKR